MAHKNKPKIKLPKFISRFLHWFVKDTLHKIYSVILIVLLLALGTMYGIARWYIYTQRNVPYNLGVTFVPDYASSLDLNPNDTLQAILSQLQIRNIRYTSYWSDIETSPGQYNFQELDYEFALANQYHVKVNLSVGLRQPRWPECHIPSWAKNESYGVWKPQIMKFIAVVVNRYKNNPALESYELENEYFLKAFGTCTNFSRNRLVAEYNLVKSLDPNHPVIISRSNNAIGTPIGQPTPDEFGVSIYKRVWDRTITHRYFEYPIPAWYYAFIAGVEKIITGKNTIIHELQAEPWPPTTMTASSEKEQLKSMNPQILTSRFNYGEATGMKTIDLWGVEWWYYQKEIKHDPAFWNIAKSEFKAVYN
ncbi:MAG TPA: hypothetical protein VMR76_01255 [Candidatus Saccharimonadia bacterium]|nr:hypothetical protein [Candidatus Saccharimonadia bacterium]